MCGMLLQAQAGSQASAGNQSRGRKPEGRKEAEAQQVMAAGVSRACPLHLPHLCFPWKEPRPEEAPRDAEIRGQSWGLRSQRVLGLAPGQWPRAVLRPGVEVQQKEEEVVGRKLSGFPEQLLPW